ncbi:MAG: recombinase, partial [Oscillospiraceae bacterium]|nr:recombinase [Oscillospiraceae bacterium]
MKVQCKIFEIKTGYARHGKQCDSGGKQCNSPHVTEDQIKLVFIMAVNQLIQDKEKYISDFEE